MCGAPAAPCSYAGMRFAEPPEDIKVGDGRNFSNPVYSKPFHNPCTATLLYIEGTKVDVQVNHLNMKDSVAMFRWMT
jgi:hypothetical protein